MPIPARSYLKAGVAWGGLVGQSGRAVSPRFPQHRPCDRPILSGPCAFSTRLRRRLLANARRYSAIVVNGIWTLPGLSLFCITRRNGRAMEFHPRRGRSVVQPPVPLEAFEENALVARAVRDSASRQSDLLYHRDGARSCPDQFRPNTWNSVVVPYGIRDPETEARDAAREVEVFHSRFPEIRGRRFLLFLGRIHEKKGCDLMLEVFAASAGNVPDVDLVMAGPDQSGMQAALESRASQLGVASRIHWTGMGW